MAMAEAALSLAKEKKERQDKRRKQTTEAKKKEQEERTHICFIDLRKAYDMVNRDMLLTEMIDQKFPAETIAAVAKLMDGTSFAIEGTSASVKSFRGC